MDPRTKRHLDKKRAWIRAQKNKPCKVCRRKYHFAAMQFDHVRGRKKFTISKNPGTAWEKTKAEIAKCDVVCANCHAIRSWKRRRRGKA